MSRVGTHIDDEMMDGSSDNHADQPLLHPRPRRHILPTGNSAIVRRNVFTSIQDASRTSKALLALTVLSELTQIVATSVVLLMTKSEPCDGSLRLFLQVYAIRVSLSLVLGILQRLKNPENVDADQTWVDRLKSFTDFFGTCWWIIGNWWIFSPNTCLETSPAVYYTTFAWIMLGYFYLAVPFLICLLLLCCLPCILLVATRTAPSEGSNGATEKQLKELPVDRYHKVATTEEEEPVCAVCMTEYEEGESIKRLPCRHFFHDKCIDQWLLIKKTCPLCNRPIDADSSTSDESGENNV